MRDLQVSFWLVMGMVVLLAGCPDTETLQPLPESGEEGEEGDESPVPLDVLEERKDAGIDAVDEPLEIGYLHPFSPKEAPNLATEPNRVRVDLVAESFQHDTPFGLVAGYAYNGQTPGPTIRGKIGDILEVHLTNNLMTPTTIHWHGAHVPWNMDGVTWNQDPVEPGETFVYSFPLTQSGTFWYHPHFDTDSQVDLGLYSLLIVDDPGAAETDHELLLVFDSFEENVHEESTEHTHLHGGTVIRDWLVNGASQPELSFPAGTTVRVRMLNASNTGYLDLRWPGLRKIGGDQGLFGRVESPDFVRLSPGDRVEVEWLVGSEPFEIANHPYTLMGGSTYGDPKVVLNVVPFGEGSAPLGASWGEATEAPTQDPGSTDVVYVFTGSPRSGEWLINGESYPEVKVEEVAAGESIVMEVRNLSPSEHPFHMHGVSFEVLSVNGVPPTNRRIEDTMNVGIYEVVRLRVINTNPGDWMVHCHILSHAHNGMMTVIRFLE